MSKKAKLGSGKRFQKLSESFPNKIRDPKALAADIGRDKYGKQRFQKMAQQGKRKR